MKTYQAKVLVVDHETVILEIVGKMLTGEGHEVDTAVNGNEALDKIQRKTYDLILQEVKLLDMSGLELYRRIKKDN